MERDIPLFSIASDSTSAEVAGTLRTQEWRTEAHHSDEHIAAIRPGRAAVLEASVLGLLGTKVPGAPATCLGALDRCSHSELSAHG